MSLDNIYQKINNSSKYMVAVTIIGEVDAKGNNVEHILVTKDFPKEEMLKSHSAIKELIIKEMEKEN